MSSLSALSSAKAPSGVGGPFVPVNPNSPAARAGMAAAAPGARAAAQFPTLLGDRNAVIRRADVAKQGTFYRVEVGPLSAGQADQPCGNLKAAGAQCVPRSE